MTLTRFMLRITVTFYNYFLAINNMACVLMGYDFIFFCSPCFCISQSIISWKRFYNIEPMIWLKEATYSWSSSTFFQNSKMHAPFLYSFSSTFTENWLLLFFLFEKHTSGDSSISYSFPANGQRYSYILSSNKFK